MLHDEDYKKQDMTLALQHYKIALNKSPSNCYTYWEIIELQTNEYFGTKFYEEAQKLINEVINKDPENCNFWFFRGCQELKMKRWQQAISSFNYANELAYTGRFGKETERTFL